MSDQKLDFSLTIQASQISLSLSSMSTNASNIGFKQSTKCQNNTSNLSEEYSILSQATFTNQKFNRPGFKLKIG